MNPIRVLVVDDHPLMRLGVCAMINSQTDMAVVGEAGTAQQAIEQFETLRPDVTLMDLKLPSMGGVTVIQKLRQRHPQSKFVVLTTYEGDEDIFQALQAGAVGYLIKGMSHDSLVKGIRQVSAGKLYVPSEVAQRLSRRNPKSTLSDREKQVLQLLAKGNSNKAIASKLGVTESTIKAHVGVILEHLNVQDRTEAVIVALQRGLVHLEQ